MKGLRIRWQFTLWFSTVLAVLLFGFSLLLILIMRQQLLTEVDNRLQDELRELTNEMSFARSVPDVMEQARERFTDHGDYHFTLEPPQMAGTLDKSQLRFETRDVTEMGLGRCRVVSTLADGPGGPYVVNAMTSLVPFDQKISLLVTVLWVSCPVALGSGIVAGYTLARRVLSPVDRIVEVANRITATDLHQRVEVLNPGDELGRLAQTLNALIDRLQKAIEEMRRFTADAAHELRTPIAVLRSGVEVALRAPRTADEYRQTLEDAADEASRLTRLADQLLFLSRQDAGMLEIDREEVQIDALLKDVVEQLAGRAEDADVVIDVEPLETWTVRGDDTRLSQVFYNILENAVKYTQRGGRVRLSGRICDDRVQIEIEDNGPGIPSEHLPHVFKRFYRIEQSRNCEQGGTGLGLAIAQSAVTAHGGAISIRSVLGQGTVVRVELPSFRPERRELSTNLDQNPRAIHADSPSRSAPI